MTRWARSGCTQRHRKPPADPTPWNEFGSTFDVPKKFEKTAKNFYKDNNSRQISDICKSFSSEAKNTAPALGMNTGESVTRFRSKFKKISTQCEKPQADSNPWNNFASSSDECKRIKKMQFFFYENNDPRQKSKVCKDFSSEAKNTASLLGTDTSATVAHLPSKFKSEKLLNWKQKKTHVFKKKSRKKSVNFHQDVSESVTVDAMSDSNKFCNAVNKTYEPANNITDVLNSKNKKKKLELNNSDNLQECLSDGNFEMSSIDSNFLKLSEGSPAKRHLFEITSQRDSNLIKKSKKSKKRKASVQNLTIEKIHMKKQNMQGRMRKSDNFRSPDEICTNFDDPLQHQDSTVDLNIANSGRNIGNSVNNRKKSRNIDRCKDKCWRNGIMLLPREMEEEISNLKKTSRNQGVPESEIKQLVRQLRKKKELQFKKSLKKCFNCRKVGHILAACPELKSDVEQGTGICFKCGSAEHTSIRCHIKLSEFPFAKCFICHEQGHLSRNCPENKHGVYPKGGKCKLCGEIDHLKKDCPRLKKMSKEVTADVITGLISADDDNIAVNKESLASIKRKPKVASIKRKPKVVKF